MTEGRSHSESCRLYEITKYGDIFSASCLGKSTPRCIAYAKPAGAREPAETVVVGFHFGQIRRFLVTDGFRCGYPTKRCPSKLVDGGQRVCGTVYVTNGVQGKQLTFETFAGAIAPLNAGHVKAGSPLSYTVTCPAPQEDIVASTETSTYPCRLATLSYLVAAESPLGTRTFTMEQTVDCSRSVKGARSLVIYDIEWEADLPAALFLARLITLTGYPSNAKPIEIEGGWHE